MKKFIYMLALVMVFCQVQVVEAADDTPVFDYRHHNDGVCCGGDEDVDYSKFIQKYDDKGRITSGMILSLTGGDKPEYAERKEYTEKDGGALFIYWNPNYTSSYGCWCVYCCDELKPTDSVKSNKSYYGQSFWADSSKSKFPLYEGGDSPFGKGSLVNPDRICNLGSAYAFATNIPIFPNEEAVRKYLENGDVSGAVNKDVYENVRDGGDGHTKKTNYKKNGPYVKIVNVSTSNLGRVPHDGAYADYLFSIPNEKDYTDLQLIVDYSNYVSATIPSMYNKGIMFEGSYSEVVPLSSCITEYGQGLRVFPLKKSENPYSSQLDTFMDKQCMFGGTLDVNVGASAIITANGNFSVTVSSSYMDIKIAVRGKRKDTGEIEQGMAVVETLDILNKKNEEIVAHPDEEGNYTPDDSKKVITDKDGNVTVKNNVNVDGGGGGGSSSATGGNVTNNNSNTFTFPDNLKIDLNVNGLNNGINGSGSSGAGGAGGNASVTIPDKIDVNLKVGDIDVSLEEKKGFFDKLFDSGNKFLDFMGKVFGDVEEDVSSTVTNVSSGLTEFVAGLFTGFGLFKMGDSGLNALLKENISFVPKEIWDLVTFGISALIFLAILSKFWHK